MTTTPNSSAEAKKRYVQRHPERVAESKRRYRERNREKLRAAGKVYRESDPEKVRAQKKRWRTANRDKANAIKRRGARRAYAKNPEKFNARTKAYLKANPHFTALCHARRRALLLAPGSPGITPEQWEAIRVQFEGKCAYCDKSATTMDHVVPLSRGGLDAPWNVVPACKRCNSSKGAALVWDWVYR